jgi:tRNA(fMet)-specific endonuclease VapC
MKYLLDTDHLSILQLGVGRDREQLLSHLFEHRHDAVHTSVVSFHEQVIAAHSFMSKSANLTRIVQGYQILARIIESFEMISVCDFDESAARVFADLRKAKIRIATMDLRIASIAIDKSMIVVTRNRSDFEQIPNLQTEDWIS